MVKLLKKNQGFTLIELIVVMAIIGILATITTTGISRYQTDTRDARRASSVTVIAEALEKYYDKNGEYPSCSAITQPLGTITRTVLPGINESALTTPKDTSGTNSITCTDLSAGSSGSDNFAYVGDGSAACTSGAACLQFTLKYREESTGEIKSVTSRRQTKIATSGTELLSVAIVNASQMSLSWTAIPNTISYELWRSTSASFSSPTATSFTTNSALVTGLMPNQTYYFQVRPIAASENGAWSNAVAKVTTVSTPTLSGSVASTTQLNTSWTTSMSGVTYELQRSATSTFTSPTTTSYSASSAAITGLVPGSTYYFRVRTVVAEASYTGSWSNSLTLTTSINPPSGTLAINVSLPSSTIARGATGSVSCDTGTSLEYSIRYNSTNVAADGSWSSWTVTTVRDQSGAYQGNKYTFQAQARCIGSDASSTYVTSVTNYVIPPMTTPAIPTYASPGSFKDEVYAIVNYVSYCPTGTWMVNGTFHTVYMLTGSAWGPHSFGYNDWWNLGESYSSGGLQYWGRYQCTTSYVTSPSSPESYNVIYVYQ